MVDRDGCCLAQLLDFVSVRTYYECQLDIAIAITALWLAQLSGARASYFGAWTPGAP
jgi:hypothetical protein